MNKFELLAPAGSYEAFIAAVENGADAVYLGGKLFNARANASNFSNDELLKIVNYAHLRNVKIYVTLNTLLSDTELKEALNFAYDLYNMGIDAVIVQDLGLAKILHQYIPNLNLHASTQMTVYNLEGVQKLKELGFTRVVLARELSLSEIKYICENTDVEIEVFVHGALCISYSGQCLMSSMIGDRSGNRGKCAQPCRLPYTLIKNDKEISHGYLLSPKDLSTIKYINKLPNITSLKIEGRMKSPEYVATVVSTYRKAIDKNNISEEDQNNLTQIFNRGGFTSAYHFEKQGKDMMCYEKPKNWGIYLGKVTNYDGKRYIQIDNVKDLKIGDGIEIWNGENNSPSTIVSELTNNKIGRISGNIHVGDKVYKTSSKLLMTKARESYSRNFVKKSFVDVSVNISANSAISVTISGFDFQSNVVPEVAKTNSLSLEKIIEQFKKTGNTPFEIKDINVNLDENLFIPISVLNEIRRNAFECYEQWLIKKEKHNLLAKPLYEPESITHQKNKKVSLFVKYLEENHLQLSSSIDNLYVPIKEALIKQDVFEKFDCQKYILLPTITKNNYDTLIKKNITKLAKLCDGFVISNIGQLDYFKDIQTTLIANYTFNIFNSYTIKQLKDFRFKKVILSPELTNNQINNIKSQIETEIIAYGQQCVMTSEHCPIGANVGGASKNQKCSMPCIKKDKYFLRDRLNFDFRIIPDNTDCQSTIYNCKTTSLESKNLNVDSIRIDIIDETIDEISTIIKTHKNGQKLNGEKYTNAHAVRNV